MFIIFLRITRSRDRRSTSYSSNGSDLDRPCRHYRPARRCVRFQNETLFYGCFWNSVLLIRIGDIEFDKYLFSKTFYSRVLEVNSFPEETNALSNF